MVTSHRATKPLLIEKYNSVEKKRTTKTPIDQQYPLMKMNLISLCVFGKTDICLSL